MKYFYHPFFEEHEAGGMCPETFERIKKTLDYLRMNHEEIEPSNGEDYVSLVHSKGYMSAIKNFSEQPGISQPFSEVYVSPGTYKAACYAVGASVESAELAVRGEPSFALVRPPGHHAPFGGFCIFNNIAIAAKELLNRGRRVVIVDWDSHHGNGTQNILRGLEDVIYFSTHQSPLYPGSGKKSTANCYNFSLSAGSGDEEFISVLNNELEPLLNSFAPDVVGISAGFDSMEGDPLTGLRFSSNSYLELCRLIEDYDSFFVLEGGYNPENVFKGVKQIFEYFD